MQVREIFFGILILGTKHGLGRLGSLQKTRARRPGAPLIFNGHRPPPRQFPTASFESARRMLLSHSTRELRLSEVLLCKYFLPLTSSFDRQPTFFLWANRTLSLLGDTWGTCTVPLSHWALNLNVQKSEHRTVSGPCGSPVA